MSTNRNTDSDIFIQPFSNKTITNTKNNIMNPKKNKKQKTHAERYYPDTFI